MAPAVMSSSRQDDRYAVCSRSQQRSHTRMAANRPYRNQAPYFSPASAEPCQRAWCLCQQGHLDCPITPQRHS